MTSVWAPEVSRSTADWARSGSLIMVSHSAGSRFEVAIVGGHEKLPSDGHVSARWRS
jgi:hypothetical protein